MAATEQSRTRTPLWQGQAMLWVVVLAVAVYAGMLLMSDTAALTTDFRSLPIDLMGLAILLCTVGHLIRYLRWEYYLRHLDMRIPFWSSLVCYLASFSMTITPGKAGEIVKSVMLKERFDLPISRTAPVLVAERVTDLIALVLLGSIGCLAFDQGLLAAALGGLIVIGLVLVCGVRSVGEALLALASRVWLVKRAVPAIRSAYDALWQISTPLPTTIATSISIVSWALQCAGLYVICLAFETIPLSVTGSLFVYSAPLMAGTLAMLPGGLGLTEGSMAGLLLSLSEHATLTAAVAVTLLTRFFSFWWVILLGFAALAFWYWNPGNKLSAQP